MTPLEIDLMEYANGAAAQLAYVTSDLICNEDMSNISDWTDKDAGYGESSQVTFDGKSCMKLDSGVKSDGSTACRSRNTGTFGNRTIFITNVYCDSIGTFASIQSLNFLFSHTDHGLYLFLYSDGLYCTVYDEMSTDYVWYLIGNYVVQDTWQEWKFDVNWVNLTFDLYIDGVLIISDVAFDYPSISGNGYVLLGQYGGTTGRLSYIDFLYIFNDGDLQSYSESYIKTQGNYSLKGVATTGALNKTLTRTIT